MEEEITIEETVEVDPLIKEIVEKPPVVFNSQCPGCGALLGLKIALQTIGQCIVVGSPGCISSMAKSLGIPFLSVRNPAAAASSISRNGTNVLVYAGDCATKNCLQTLMANRKGNFIYISYNNQGCCEIGKRVFQRDVARLVPPYSATASLSEVGDYIKKIKKAVSRNGIKFIELLAPCPRLWKFDPSNTIEVSRLAVETGLWPLYEKEKKLILTKRLTKLEPMERYFSILGVEISPEEIKKLEERAQKNLHIK